MNEENVVDLAKHRLEKKRREEKEKLDKFREAVEKRLHKDGYLENDDE